jgi:hypothetical protein
MKNPYGFKRIISMEIETEAILPAKNLGVNPLAREAMLADFSKYIFLLVLRG